MRRPEANYRPRGSDAEAVNWIGEEIVASTESGAIITGFSLDVASTVTVSEALLPPGMVAVTKTICFFRLAPATAWNVPALCDVSIGSDPGTMRIGAAVLRETVSADEGGFDRVTMHELFSPAGTAPGAQARVRTFNGPPATDRENVAFELPSAAVMTAVWSVE